MRRFHVLVSVVALGACGDPRRAENDGQNPFGGGDDAATGSADDAGSSGMPLDPPTPGDTSGGPPSGDDASSGDGSGGTTLAVDGSDDDGSTTVVEGSSTGGGSSSGEPASDTYNDGTVDVAVTLQSSWPAGECNDVVVTNVSGAMLTWEVTLDLPGTIDQLWNANVEEMPGMGVFTGADFNATLAPGAHADFGFCVLY